MTGLTQSPLPKGGTDATFIFDLKQHVLRESWLTESLH